MPRGHPKRRECGHFVPLPCHPQVPRTALRWRSQRDVPLRSTPQAEPVGSLPCPPPSLPGGLSRHHGPAQPCCFSDQKTPACWASRVDVASCGRHLGAGAVFPGRYEQGAIKNQGPKSADLGRTHKVEGTTLGSPGKFQAVGEHAFTSFLRTYYVLGVFHVWSHVAA